MKMPSFDIYERELRYMPYKKSLERVAQIVCSEVPRYGDILDLMCGTGYLLGKIKARRPDLYSYGVDINKEFITEAQEKYWKRGMFFETGDILTWSPWKERFDASKDKFDAVICTGALHHIAYEKQEEVVRKFSEMSNPNGLVIISDCYIDDYQNEKQRKVAGALLGYEYLKETILNGAPDEVVKATIEILHNDVMKEEFKTSLEKRLPIFKKYFSKVDIEKTWPSHQTGYGDYIAILRR